MEQFAGIVQRGRVAKELLRGEPGNVLSAVKRFKLNGDEPRVLSLVACRLSQSGHFVDAADIKASLARRAEKEGRGEEASKLFFAAARLYEREGFLTSAAKCMMDAGRGDEASELLSRAEEARKAKGPRTDEGPRLHNPVAMGAYDQAPRLLRIWPEL